MNFKWQRGQQVFETTIAILVNIFFKFVHLRLSLYSVCCVMYTLASSSGYSCFTQLGGSSLCLNFDKFRDETP